MNGAVAGGLMAAITVAALTVSSASDPTGGPPGGGVAASGSQVVIVSGDGSVVSSQSTSVAGSASVSVTVGPIGCPASPERLDDLLGTVQRLLCALPALPADITRHAFPPTLPWLGLMPF